MASINEEIGFNINLNPLNDMNKIFDEMPQAFDKNEVKIREYNNRIEATGRKAQKTAEEIRQLQRELDALRDFHGTEFIESQLMPQSDKDIDNYINQQSDVIKLQNKIDTKSGDLANLNNTIDLLIAKRDSVGDNDNNFFGSQNNRMRTQMVQLTRAVGNMVGISPQITSGMTEVVGGIMNVIPPVLAVTAAIKAVTSVLQSKYEWDQMNARLESIGGDSAEARKVANEIGVKYDKTFNQVYQGLIWADPEHSSKNAATILQNADMLATIKGGFGYDYAAKMVMQGLTSGNFSQLGNSLGLSYGETKGLDKTMKNLGESGDWQKAIGITFGLASNVIQDINATYDNLRNIQSMERKWNSFTNNLASSITTGEGAYNAFQNSDLEGLLKDTLISADNSFVPVKVTDSVSLSKDSIDALTDYKEHQFLNVINLQHTTPQISFEVNQNNGGTFDHKDISAYLTNLIIAESSTGAPTYTGDDL